jgi:hypothetical protein
MGQYSEAIATALQAKGAVVDCYEERPALNVLTKALIRYSPLLIQGYAHAYFDGIIEATKSNNYDFILMIRAEAITKKFICDLRGYHRNAAILLYQWDSMTLTKGPIDKLGLFDQRFSFDKRDCAHYSMTFLPLFYIDDYRDIARVAVHAESDFMFVGTVHSDRYGLIKQIDSYAHAHSMHTCIYMYLPSPIVFYKMKYIDKKLAGAEKSDFRFAPLSKRETVYAMAKTRIVVDSEHPAQCGVTMRTIEALGASRKLITTNADIVKYDFYHPDNILVVDRQKVEIPNRFVEARYVEVERSIYEKYSVHNWVSAIFGLNASHTTAPREIGHDSAFKARQVERESTSAAASCL